MPVNCESTMVVTIYLSVAEYSFALVLHECSEPSGDLTSGVTAVIDSPECPCDTDEGKSMCSKTLSALGKMSLWALEESGTGERTAPGELEKGMGV